MENRVALWLAAHVRKVLGPLFSLTEGSDAARGGAGARRQNRRGARRSRARPGARRRARARPDGARRVAQARRAFRLTLYICADPAEAGRARALCTLLWTLRRGTEAGADRLLAFAAAGRTSFANEGLLSPDAYRVAGFRLCGERVVRVDIIERLSDLIRAAIPDHMRAGSRAPSPTYGFPVTPQMTSLTGCSGEAFASILRSLGFEAGQGRQGGVRGRQGQGADGAAEAGKRRGRTGGAASGARARRRRRDEGGRRRGERRRAHARGAARRRTAGDARRRRSGYRRPRG